MLDVTGSLSQRCLEVTSGIDGRTHQIDEVVLTADLMDGSGRLAALCGRWVIAAAMSEPPGPACPLCTAALTLDRVHHGAAPLRRRAQ